LFNLGKIPSLSVAAGGSWLYAFISGMSSPVVRAAGGFTLFLLASYFFRRVRILNSLSIVALLYLALNPDLLFDPSFQLSFLSGAAIAAFAMPAMQRTTQPLRLAVKRFSERTYDLHIQELRALGWRTELRLLATTIRIWTHLDDKFIDAGITVGVRLFTFAAEAMLLSACIQFALALPMVAYFHRLSVTAITANVFVVPLLCAVVPCGFAAIITGWPPLGWLTKELLLLGQAVATWHVRFEPGWRITDLPLALSLGFAGSLVILAVLIRRGNRLVWLASAAACSLFAAIYFQPWSALTCPGWLEVSGLDVSQGDSLLVVFPRGTTMLVDAGGFPGMERMARKPQVDVGEDVVSPYLWWRRVQHLDYVVLTHGHSDHMGGLVAVLDNFHPRELWTGAEPDSEAWQAVLQHAARNRTTVRFLRRQSSPLSLDAVTIRVLAPSPDYIPQEVARNDDSLVLELAYGKRTVLLAGDAEKPTEWDMLSNSCLRPVTFLKVGHHGSKTSSSEEFLSAVQPEFALISAGYKNSFHHPHPSVIERLAEHHAAVFRTDERGLVTFRTDGQKVELSTFH
jgi:competence protein ComEC